MKDFNHSVTHYFKQEAEQSIHYLSIDCVVFGFHEGRIRVLLLRWKGTSEWSLPGGFIRKAESVDAAAVRILRERTGLQQIFLQQFHIFGDAVRYNQEDTWQRIGLPVDLSKWSERTISLGYYALVEYAEVTPRPDLLTDACDWWSLEDLPNLLFDHNRIIAVALENLRRQLPYQPVSHLLPETFTMPELQRLYETILGRPLDARNFYKKVQASGILQRTDERRKGTPYKSPYLYRFDPGVYPEVVREGSLSFP
ncbi:NUDIX domain-containing protein [Nibrella saemangeumensis]|uniref:NUDIX domain-containing protein n=1 Tax=Nibrella saemangeumensis TaxID=1084526 RepID=A0ABP8NTX8_9BACT